MAYIPRYLSGVRAFGTNRKRDGPLEQEGSQAPSAKEAEFISNFFSK